MNDATLEKDGQISLFAEPEQIGGESHNKKGQSHRQTKISDIALNKIIFPSTQPRKYINQSELADLRASIKEHGIIQPVIVKEQPDGIILIAGQRRFQAAKELGLKSIPAVFTNGDPATIALIENIQRTDLNAIDEAEALEMIKHVNKYTLDNIASIVGKSKSTISEIISITTLPDTIKDRCRSNTSTPKSILIQIAKLKSPEEMIAAYESHLEGTLTHIGLRKWRHPVKLKTRSLNLQSVASITKSVECTDFTIITEKKRLSLRIPLENLRDSLSNLITKMYG